MTQYAEKLSGFLDGELSDAETQDIEQALANDPTLQAELEGLMAADSAAQDDFAAILDEPVPFQMAETIKNAPLSVAANTPWSPGMWRLVAAGVVAVALLLGGGVGYLSGVSQGSQMAAAPAWLSDIAEYHQVYATQKRHLVEVGADEADHIEKWLTNTVGAQVRIPDLAAHSLTFQGARLLVAGGKPVAQLMFTDMNAQVVALCLVQTQTPKDGFSERTINAFDMVSWGAGTANFVIVGDEGRDDLLAIAQAAALQV